MTTTRPSGVDGLSIYGDARIRYSLVHEPSGARIDYGTDLNQFRTVREAKAAAVALDPLLDWSDPDLGEHAKTWTTDYRLGIFRAMAKAMTESA